MTELEDISILISQLTAILSPTLGNSDSITASVAIEQAKIAILNNRVIPVIEEVKQ